AHYLKHASLSVGDVPEGTEFRDHTRVHIFFVAWLIGKDCFWRRFSPIDELLQKFRFRIPSIEYLCQRLDELPRRRGWPRRRCLTAPRGSNETFIKLLDRITPHLSIHINISGDLECLDRRLGFLAEKALELARAAEIDRKPQLIESILDRANTVHAFANCL